MSYDQNKLSLIPALEFDLFRQSRLPPLYMGVLHWKNTARYGKGQTRWTANVVFSLALWERGAFEYERRGEGRKEECLNFTLPFCFKLAKIGT
jgi:hypothetical protein